MVLQCGAYAAKQRWSEMASLLLEGCTLSVRCGALSAFEVWCRCLCEAVSLSVLTYHDKTELCQSVLHIPTFMKALGTECYCLCSCAVHAGI